MDRKRLSVWIALVLCIACIKFFSLFPAAVERYYSTGIYPPVSRLLRGLFGWLPFSVGDIFYGIVFIYLLYKIVLFFRKWFRKQLDRPYLLGLARRIVFVLLIIYIAFNLLWGLNYNRQGIATQLRIQMDKYSSADLTRMVNLIVDRLNALDTAARINRPPLQEKKFLFAECSRAYAQLAKQDRIFLYRTASVKPSMFSLLGNWLGFTGYYNPFSGEAQVNSTVPLFVQPFTSCHEIGHQLGYAKENEANFAGYLSAKSSLNPAFRYSVYFDLYIYAAGELYMRDSTLLKPIRSRLQPGIRSDYKELQQFYQNYSNPFEPYIRRLYGKYLKANEQPQGIMSYNEVIGWLIAYSKKYGEKNI